MGRDDGWGKSVVGAEFRLRQRRNRVGTRDVIGARTSLTLPVMAAASDTMEPGSRNSFILNRTYRRAPAARQCPAQVLAE